MSFATVPEGGATSSLVAVETVSFATVPEGGATSSLVAVETVSFATVPDNRKEIVSYSGVFCVATGINSIIREKTSQQSTV